VLALVTAVALCVGGCGSIKERKENAERIIDSVDAATAAKSAQMVVSIDVKLTLKGADRQLAGVAASNATADGPGTAVRRTLPAAADLRNDRVAYFVTRPDGATEAARIYQGTTIYARRASQPAAASAQRPWVRLDLTGIDPDEIDSDDVELADAVRRVGETQGFDSPLFLLKLFRGALSGSVKEVGAENLGGVPTTHFTLNLDREKALRDEDEDVQDAYEVVFKSVFATRNVFPGEVWLDEQGLPRRYSLTLKSNLRRRSIADLKLTVELFDVGRPVDIALPAKSETAKVEDLGNLLDAILGATP
jgi:hypothetical protein